MIHERLLSCEQDSLQLAVELAPLLSASLPKDRPFVCFLDADLGMGKTFLVRAVLRAMGWPAAVKSPTYTLIESYQLDEIAVHHLDLYRLADAEELEFLGMRDLCAQAPAVLFVEWPSKGLGFLPKADLTCHWLPVAKDGRLLTLTAHSQPAQQCLRDLADCTL